MDPPTEPIKSEQIKLESVANHIAATSITKAIAAKEKAEHIKRVVAIVEAGNYQFAPFGGLPSCRTRILWRANGSMITPGGIEYEQEEDKLNLPFDLQMLVSDQKCDFPDYRDPVQQGHRSEAIHPKTKVILHEPMGWCVVINGFMHPLEDFLKSAA